ncbi:MAG: response regulator transcription factor [Fidelibacterota bacterium]
MNKIFLVDDDTELLELLQDFLINHDFEVMTNNDGKNVLEQISKFEPSLVVLDVNLPDADGFDILRIIRSNALTASIPVIMLTGEDGVNSQVKGLTSGADDYVLKPFDLNVLYARILNLLKKNIEQTRTKYDQKNLLNHLITIYSKRNYDIYTKHSRRFPDYPSNWNGLIPDLVIIKKNKKCRAFLLESAQSILEERFLRELEKLSVTTWKNELVEGNIVVRSKESLKKCQDIFKEYGFKFKIKLITKSKRRRRYPAE